MTQIIDFIAYTAFQAGVGLLNLLPYPTRVQLIGKAIGLFVRYSPKYTHIAQKNLLLAFPDESQDRRDSILAQSHYELARLVCDVARMNSLSDDWFRSQVEFPSLSKMREHIARGHGILIATGHLGSFELLAHAFRAHCAPVSVVIREFKSPRMNAWWRAMRSRGGNCPIPRDGAFRRIIKGLRDGKAIAIPFDQNVRKEHADFVDWFGRKAATTRALALAATMQPDSPVVAFSLSALPSGRYRIETEECNLCEIRGNEQLTDEEKRVAITQRISFVYQEMIRRNPAAWFWLHRRWKTTPDSSAETFYQSSTTPLEG